jgi:hypothetical protein
MDRNQGVKRGLSRFRVVCISLVCGVAFGQTPRFVIADVHVTPPELENAFIQANPPVNGRYEFHSASMIDLIQAAYGLAPDKILCFRSGSGRGHGTHCVPEYDHGCVRDSSVAGDPSGFSPGSR